MEYVISLIGLFVGLVCGLGTLSDQERRLTTEPKVEFRRKFGQRSFYLAAAFFMVNVFGPTLHFNATLIFASFFMAVICFIVGASTIRKLS